MLQILRHIAASIYGSVLRVRHWLFDAKILRSKSYDIPIICVGNITVGGTGKTPTVEMLVRHYSQKYNVAVLSRGFGRKTKGYREVTEHDSYLKVGDEPLQIKRKFPQVRVVVCEKRTRGVERIIADFPEVNLIIMDDGFQHRHIKPLINIITVENSRPVQEDKLLPLGTLRDTLSSLLRAHYFIVTKCPENMQGRDMMIHRTWLKTKASQQVYYSRMQVVEAAPVFSGVEGRIEPGGEVIAMSGIGNAKSFYDSVAKRYKVVGKLEFKDHHIYRMGDLKTMRRALDKHPNAVILMTEKDAIKLFNAQSVPEDLRSRMFFETIQMQLFDNVELFENIDSILKYNNHKNGALIFGS